MFSNGHLLLSDNYVWAMNFSGENISLTDALFVDNVTGDLESWRVKSEATARVLVFPPVNNYHRFLIHKVRHQTAE